MILCQFIRCLRSRWHCAVRLSIKRHTVWPIADSSVNKINSKCGNVFINWSVIFSASVVIQIKQRWPSARLPAPAPTLPHINLRTFVQLLTTQSCASLRNSWSEWHYFRNRWSLNSSVYSVDCGLLQATLAGYTFCVLCAPSCSSTLAIVLVPWHVTLQRTLYIVPAGYFGRYCSLLPYRLSIYNYYVLLFVNIPIYDLPFTLI